MEDKIKQLEKEIEQTQLKYEQLLSRTGHQRDLIEMLEKRMQAIESNSKYLNMQFDRLLTGRENQGF